jgi:putative heme-binding domain-containing protein
VKRFLGTNLFAGLTLSVSSLLFAQPRDEAPPLLRKGDRICIIGNALAERMQHHGWLETILQSRLPDHELSIRNLGFGADTLTVRQRTAGFGTPDEHLTRCQADVIFAFFGFNESFAGAEGLETFKSQLRDFISHTREVEYNGREETRLVLFSPIAHEDLNDPNLPDGRQANERIAMYAEAMAEVAKTEDVAFVDLFTRTRTLFAESTIPWTINGVHLTEYGNRELSSVIQSALLPEAGSATADEQFLEKIRAAILEKNLLWFNRYRATDGFNVYGGRSSLKYTDEISNYDVLQRELEILDVMAANRDRRIWALLKGEEFIVDDSNAPPEIAVKTNKPGGGADGEHEFPSGEEAIGHMKVAEGLSVNLFADESHFPELVNPVQMAWDTRGRLWVAAWPTYPHWQPQQPMNDKLLILEDTDGDGRADQCHTFADDLHNPTGFEFWNGGVLLALAPDLLFLKDTDGDNRADLRIRLLHGISSADTHHSANSFVIGPGGALYFQEGTFHQSQIETIHGPVRNRNAAVWRFEPRTFRVERYIPYNFANPHGFVFDRWGQDFVTDGTGNDNYYALPFSGHLPAPEKHRRYFTYFRQRSRPCAGTEILSSEHFGQARRGTLLIADVIQFKGILQYRFKDDGAGFTAEEIEPIVQSVHPTFRPSDIEVGPDGALYFLDWTNPLIGHMQHHLRDPSRDHKHGRVYRVTRDGRPLLTPQVIAGRSIDELLDALKNPSDRVRYRARIELGARDSQSVVAAARRWAGKLESTEDGYEHHLLEALWIQQQHNTVDRDLLERLMRAQDPRARAAAMRVIRHLRHKIPDALALLADGAGDSHPRVRLEVVVATSFFNEPEAVVVALDTLRHPSDKFLAYALDESMRALEPVWKRALQDGVPIVAGNPEGESYLLSSVTSEELVLLPRSPSVFRAMLTREGVGMTHRREAAGALADQHGESAADTVLDAVMKLAEKAHGQSAPVIKDLGRLLFTLHEEGMTPNRAKILALVGSDQAGPARQLGFALHMLVYGQADGAYQVAGTTMDRLQDFLGAVSMIPDSELRNSVADIIRPLMFNAPAHLKGHAAFASGVSVAFYQPNPKSVELSAFDALEPKASGVVSEFSLDIPQVLQRDAFALVFQGMIDIPTDGSYTFYTHSDDGSRLYIDDIEVVDNDGLHGMVEVSGTTTLAAGRHRITVTYYDNGGGDGLVASWQGPGFLKQRIPAGVLSTNAANEICRSAVLAMAHVPGHTEQKFRDAMLLIGAGSHVDAAVTMIDAIPKREWPANRMRPLIDTIGAYAQGLPPRRQTQRSVLAALDLGKRLARSLPADEQREVTSILEGFGGTVVLIRTVPHQMLYDVSVFQVERGKPVAIVLQNNDMMPHNLVVTRPGRLATVGQAAEKLAAEFGDNNPDNYIPETDDILHFTKLLFPGEAQRLTFVAPDQTGDYPFVCTFPGHWMRMNGTMKVVDKVEGETVISRTQAVIEEVAVRDVVRSWKLTDLADSVENGLDGRSMKRGEEMFTVAGCIKCHTFDGVGADGGPDLTAVGDKYHGVALLRQILEPSCEINEEYVFSTFVLNDGRDVYGRIVLDDGAEVHVVQDLQAPTVVTRIPRSQIKDQIPSKISSMPTGLLVILTREEILDLLAYLESGTK